MVRLLLEAGADIDSQDVPGSGMTALAVATLQRRLEVVRLLLDHGANKETATWSGGTRPLHLAVFENDVEGVRLLLDRGAHIEATHGQGWRALRIAAHKGYQDRAASTGPGCGGG